MSPYAPIEFSFQVQNDATVVETAYLCPSGLPWGASLEVTPAQAHILPGEAAIFHCRLALDDQVIRPGCANDQGFRLTAWRIAQDADEQWGSCFYFVRPRVQTKLEILRGRWYEQQVTVLGRLSLDTDQQVDLTGQLPLRVRIRLERDDEEGPIAEWVTAAVEPSGAFTVKRSGVTGPAGARLRIQAWFDRTDLLASARSEVFEVRREVLTELI